MCLEIERLNLLNFVSIVAHQISAGYAAMLPRYLSTQVGCEEETAHGQVPAFCHQQENQAMAQYLLFTIME